MRFAWIDERPFNYLDDGTLTGCDVALARAAFARAGIHFEPIHTTFAELLPGLTGGLWEVTTGMFTTPDRLRLAAFTRPVWSLRDAILVPIDNTDVVHGYASFASTGGRLAVLHEQVQAENAIRNGVPSENLIYFDDYSSAVTAVRDGRAAGYASVALAHREHLATYPDFVDLAVVSIPEQETPPALGSFACSSAAIRDALDVVLGEILGEAPPGEPSPDPSAWPIG